MCASLAIPVAAADWQALRMAHRERVERWTGPMRARRARGERHPVADFLVTYYSSSLGRLEQWHPGFGQVLEDAPGTRGLFSARHYRREDEVVFADPLLIDAKQAARLAWILDLLRRTRDRPPAFVCHGRHEWAMVYSGAEIRHRESVPLRLPQAAIDEVVEEGPLCCSHYDAFRFFAPGTRSWNRFQPELLTRAKNRIR